MAKDASEVTGGQVEQEPTVDGAGENQVVQGTASETEGPATQEPTTPAAETLTRAQYDAELAERLEVEKRRLQSNSDRQLHQDRQHMRAQDTSLRQQATENARMAGLDDEELGAEVRARSTRDAQTQQVRAQTTAETARVIGGQLLESITDPTLRSEIEAAMNQGKFSTWTEMNLAIIGRTSEAASAAAATKAATAAVEAAKKEIMAELRDTPTPDVGRSRPTGAHVDLSKLSSQELLSQGWDEAVAAKNSR